MERNAGYEIKRLILYDDNKGFVLGENLRAPNPYVTWKITEGQGRRSYDWGHYFPTEEAAVKDFLKRTGDYEKENDVAIFSEGPRQDTYKYYSTQRPVDIATYPETDSNPLLGFYNYDQRLPVEGGAFLAWGELIYAKPLTGEEMKNYELRPSRENRDVRRQMDTQAQTVGKWEDSHRVPEQKRLTWFYPDFGSYVAKEYVTPERLADFARGVELSEKACSRRQEKEKQPIAKQLEAAREKAREHQRPEAPGKKAPDRGGR